MRHIPSPLKKQVGNWWHYQFRSRWWRMTLLKALIRLEHGNLVIILLSVWRRKLFSVRDTMSQLTSRKTAIRNSPCNQGVHIYPIFPEKQLQTARLLKAVRYFFLAFEDTPPSISSQLPLEHNWCLPTRLPSTSCLVTIGLLLSTTECLTNSMSELNLDMPLIYPPHWIDRSWLHRGSLSQTVACWIFTLSAFFLILKSNTASYYNS